MGLKSKTVEWRDSMKKKQLIAWVSVICFILLVVVGVKYIKHEKEPSQVSSEKGVNDIRDVSNFDIEALSKEKKPVLINFTASWCVPCKTFNPLLEKVSKEYKGKVIIKIIDVEKHRDIASKYPIRVIPTQILIDVNGKPFEPKEDLGIYGFMGYSKEGSTKNDLTVHEGAMSEEQLIKLLKAMGMKE